MHVGSGAVPAGGSRHRGRWRAVAAAAFFLAAAFGSRGGLAGEPQSRPVSPAFDPWALVLAQYVPQIAQTDALGLGKEARDAAAWAATRGRVTLEERGSVFSLADDAGNRRELSGGLGRALVHCREFVALTPATILQPVTYDDLSRAFLSPAGVARVREIFAATIRAPLVVDAERLLLEVGGEAVLDGGGIRLLEIPDVTRQASVRLGRLMDDPEGIRRLYRDEPLAMSLLDESGALQAVIERWPVWEAKGVPAATRLKALRTAASNVLRNAADSWTLTPKAQIEAIAGRSWSGRYAGRWHTHPPAIKEDRFIPGDEPSPDDVRNALESGQYLTIAFRTDGFVVYDLALLHNAGRNDSKARTIVYRSPEWQKEFEALRTGSK